MTLNTISDKDDFRPNKNLLFSKTHLQKMVDWKQEVNYKLGGD